MKIEPVYQCPGCKRYLRFTQEDVRVLTFGQRYEIDCVACGRTTALRVGHYNSLYPSVEVEEEAPPPPLKKDAPPLVTHEKLEQEALRVYGEYQKRNESVAATAKALKITQQKVKEVLSHLPEKASVGTV